MYFLLGGFVGLVRGKTVLDRRLRCREAQDKLPPAAAIERIRSNNQSVVALDAGVLGPCEVEAQCER